MGEVVDKLEERDDNFYRVMMQLDPLTDPQRWNGQDRENSFSQLSKLSDARLVERLSNRMNLLEKKIYSQLQSFEQLQEALGKNQERLAHIPSVLPINIADYTMSSGYGYRVDPIYGASKFHEGLDFAAAKGTDVFATGDGIVTLASREAGYGNCIDIDHGYNYLTRYAHLSEILVKPGESVKRGQLIGKVGSTGKSTGPHLHYEVRFKDIPQNPVNYYYMDLSPEEYYEMIRIAENAGHVMD
ncbi:MAG: M23 family metallopeptidase [Muribaculaceae bacterium]|nr:M23 family metallopeptidase [Muribaculaceae bacterium]